MLVLARKLEELLHDVVVLDRKPWHDSPANPAERAIKTPEEQVKVMRLDSEKRTGVELLANSCLWLWLMCHAGCVDSRFGVLNKWSHAVPRRVRQRVHLPVW